MILPTTTRTGRLAGTNIILNIAGVLKSQLLSLDFIHDPLAVVIAKSPAKLVVVHTRLVLASAPELGDLLGLEDAELVPVARPVDHVLLVGGEEEVEKKLPELDGPTTSWDYIQGGEKAVIRAQCIEKLSLLQKWNLQLRTQGHPLIKDTILF